MISYIINFVLCSGLLWLAYYLLLSKERMYRFNRFYLLLSTPVSALVPLIQIKTNVAAIPVYHASAMQQIMPVAVGQPVADSVAPVGLQYDLSQILLVVYAIVTIIMLVRLCRNLYLIHRAVSGNETVPVNGAKLILINGDVNPHSFLNNIFISRHDYNNGMIEPQIISHELAHVQQAHSVDIIMMEVLQSICWFNPFMPLIRASIKLNHEFLADEAVVKTHDVPAYQYLLLAKAGNAGALTLTSKFSYLTTKKRLIMMTKNTSAGVKLFKQFALIPVLAGACMLFSQKVSAQAGHADPKTSKVKVAKENAPNDIMGQYAAILSKYTLPGTFREAASFPSKISAEDRKQLNILFNQMSSTQQQQQTVIFRPRPKPLPKVSPDEGQLNAWQNASEYGVWVDGKKVDNASLAQYKPSDLVQVFVSRLTKAAINHNKYHYQVDLMSKAYYADYYQKQTADKEDVLLIHKPGTRFM